MIRPSPSFGLVAKVVSLALPALVICAVAYDNGGYSLSSRTFWAIAIWWGVILVLAFRGFGARAAVLPALVVAGLLCSLGLLTLLSASWGSSAERSFNEFNRISLYIGVFALVCLCASHASRARWSDSLAIGICSVVALSLFSRFAPDTFSDRGVEAVVPGFATRLSFPVGYWNGLAILAALALPFLLRAASAARSPALRGIAVAAIPAIAVAIYLASSRGGYVTAGVGVVAFIIAAPERWWPATAFAIGGLGAAFAVAAVAQEDAFVNRPLSALGREQSTAALLYLVLGCVAAGGVYGLITVFLRGRPAPRRDAGLLAAGIAVVTLVATMAAVDPLSRFRSFKRPPEEAVMPSGDFVRSHLLSANGSGRWQFWEAAVDAFLSRPLLGHGAGSYEAWWAEHGSLATFVRDAHSLYLEVLAELGVLGFLLLIAAFSIGLVSSFTSLRRLRAEEARDLAAPTAAFLAFCVAAGIDWMWELTAVSVIGFTCLALIVGPLPECVGRGRQLTLRPEFVIAGLLAALLLACLQATSYLGELRIRASQDAAARGDRVAALDAADSARELQPWAATPWLQEALLREELGELRAADAAIARARRRDSSDWRLWLVTARIETKLGDGAAARAALLTARSLNPRSPLFQLR